MICHFSKVIVYTVCRYNRLTRVRDIRWKHGSVLPEAVRLNTTEQEQKFFKNYNKIIANYMRSAGIGDEGALDLTQDTTPPKSVMQQVRSMYFHAYSSRHHSSLSEHILLQA
jgi:hypothetical protein